VTSLKHFCDLNLIKGVTCENAIAVADFALRHDLKTALRHIRSFIARYEPSTLIGSSYLFHWSLSCKGEPSPHFANIFIFSRSFLYLRNVGDLTLDLEKAAAALELNQGHD